MHTKPVLIAGLRDYAETAARIRDEFGSEARGSNVLTLPITVETFPDGERYHRIDAKVLNHDVVLVCGTPTDAHFMDLIDVACAAQKYGARSLTLIIPYLGYSTMERKTKNYEVVKAKVRARMLSAIPRAKMGNSILFLDLHSEGIPYYTEGDITPHHIYSEPVITEAIQKLDRKKPLCVASTDAGRAKWVQSIANKLGALPAFCVKTRKSGTETKLESASDAVKGHHTVVFDDMIRTGGSLLDAVNAYNTAGATKIDVACTHGIFPNGSLKKILAHKKVRKVLVSDSLPHVYKLRKSLPKADQARFIIMPYAKIWAEQIGQHLEVELVKHYRAK